MSTIKERLKKQITAGKIKFDAGSEQRLEDELLGDNAGVKVTETLQSLVLELSSKVASHVRVSDLIRDGDEGHHGKGRAVDIGNEGIAGELLPQVATDAKVAELKIDEIIFDAGIPSSGQADRNKWNYDQGVKHDYDEDTTLIEHQDHIHFSVKV